MTKEIFDALGVYGKFSVKRFGAVGDGITDDTASIQATIDAAYAAGAQTVYMPSGKYKTTGPIYLDPPGNLRSSLSTPTNFAFSLALVGDGGLGNHEGFGSTVKPSSSSFVALWIGPGQGMHVRGINIMPRSYGATRAGLNPMGVGIAVSGGKGGASRTLIENCWVEHYYRGYVTGFNRDGLADSNTWVKSVASNCYLGWHIKQTQNYINSLYDCTGENNKVHIISDVGKPVNVFGGNFSTNNSLRKRFTIGSISSLLSLKSNYAGNEFTNCVFNAVVISPDSAIVVGDYDVFAIVTERFGIVPLQKTAYDARAGVITLNFYGPWLLANWGFNVSFLTMTDIHNELQSSTDLWCAEHITIFKGSGIHARGVHVENTTAVTQVLDASTGFAGDAGVTLDNMFLNYRISNTLYKKVDGNNRSLYYLQQVFPFISSINVPFSITRSQFGQESDDEPILIEVANNINFTVREMNGSLLSPNVRQVINGSTVKAFGTPYQSRACGGGKWDVTPFLPRSGRSDAGVQWVTTGDGQTPYFGYRPAPYIAPVITPAQLTIVNGTLPAVGSYPLLYGQVAYRVATWNSAAPSGKLWAMSDHQFWSYGQDLAIRWFYKGRSTVVYLSDTGRMFAGLKIGLDNGTGVLWYVVTGVYPFMGYVTVTSALDDFNPELAGTKTITYTGSVIKQEVYAITQY